MRLPKISLLGFGLLAGLAVPLFFREKVAMPDAPSRLEPTTLPTGLARATFGAGCYWCTEAVFQQLKGVQTVVSGYSGGSVRNPTYRQLCTGNTGHAEAIQVTYDPVEISYAELLEVFWQTHDPTTPDRQGQDVGSQYRSVIFYHSDEQRLLAESYKQKLDASGVFAGPIITEIVPFTEFYRAADFHQNYFEQHAEQPYCRAVIQPKLAKFKEVFQGKLKSTLPR